MLQNLPWKIILLTLTLSCLQIRGVEAFSPIEPGNTKVEQAQEVSSQKTLQLKRTKKPQRRSFVELVFLWIPLGGIAMLIAGLLMPLQWLWILGLVIWATVILSLTILFIAGMVSISKVKDTDRGQGSGMAGAIMALVLLLTVAIAFIGGLIPFIWGLVVAIELMWMIGAIFMGYGFFILLLGMLLFKLVES